MPEINIQKLEKIKNTILENVYFLRENCVAFEIYKTQIFLDVTAHILYCPTNEHYLVMLSGFLEDGSGQYERHGFSGIVFVTPLLQRAVELLKSKEIYNLHEDLNEYIVNNYQEHQLSLDPYSELFWEAEQQENEVIE